MTRFRVAALAQTSALLLALVPVGGIMAQAAGGAPPPKTFDSTGVGDTSIFSPLNLPTANAFRSASGAPGHSYWQNRADYDLRATLDTAAKTLRGEMTMRYTNNSPDTLHFVWMQVEQNAFKGNAMNGLIFPQASRFGARGFEG
ncbi:MAG: hypothetical protein ABIT38_14900, partial [Gemmatimonadaceae bacterium]